MATYYVRKSGSDSNAGTSAGAAWATIGKALGASGISSGDTVYIGAGTYRESVTVSVAPTGTTAIVGDVDGAQTGDAGEVIWSAYTTNDYAAPASAAALALGSKNFITVRRISFVGGNNVGSCVSGSGHDITLQDCNFTALTSNASVLVTTAAGVASNWLVRECVFNGIFGSATGGLFAVSMTRHSADYDAAIVVRNCVISGAGGLQAIRVASTGAGVGFGGGVVVRNNTIGGRDAIVTADANLSTTYPLVAYNNLVVAGSASFSASAAGQIVEDYNLILGGGTRTNTTAGTHSALVNMARLQHLGEELATVGRRLRPAYSPRAESPIVGFGQDGSAPSTDLIGLPRPCGTMTFGDAGTATAGGAKTLTDSGKNWGVNKWKGWQVKITSGTGAGQVKQIASHTATVLTVDGNWTTNPSTDSVYTIYRGAPATSGKATSGGATSLTDSNAAWGTNQWTGFTVAITSGTGSGQTNTVTSNTGTALTVPTWTTNPDSTSVYVIYRQTDENTVNAAAGCFERANTMTRSTVLARTGSYSLRALGPAVQDFDIPVSSVATTVTVYVQWDSTYAGTKPSMSVINGEECGVSTATATATGSSGSWEQLSLTFTPTSSGIVTIRLQSSCTSTLGSAYFDDLATTPVTPTLGDHMRAGEPIAAVGGVSLMPFAQIFGG